VGFDWVKVGITTSGRHISWPVRLLRIGGRHIRLYIRIVVIGDFPLTAVFYQDLQQTRAETSLPVGIRSGRQLLISSHSGEHLDNGDIWPDELN
jgi:hypothetical protein